MTTGLFRTLQAALAICALSSIGSAQANWLYNWEGECNDGICSHANVSLLVVDAYGPGTSFACDGGNNAECIPIKEMSWSVSFLDGTAVVNDFRGSSTDWLASFGTFPTDTTFGVLDMCFNSCLDVPILIGTSFPYPTLGPTGFYVFGGQDHFPFSRGTVSTWADPIKISEPSTLALAGAIVVALAVVTLANVEAAKSDHA